MERIRLHSQALGFGLTLSLLSPLIPTSVVGENITYPDTSAPPLRNPVVFFGTANAPDAPASFFPALSSSNSGNTVNFLSGSIAGGVYGGIAVNSTDASSNTVNITGGSIAGNVTGGWTYNGSASSNEVDISNATVGGIVFGGWINASANTVNDALSNTVSIHSGSFHNIYGAYSQGNSGTLEGNSITIDGGAVSGSGGIMAGAYSALGNNTVSSNTVTIINGTVNGTAANPFSIYGGRGQGGSDILGNTVTIDGGSITNSVIYGGQSINGAGEVTGNTVTINDGTVNATAIYGGYSGGAGAPVTGNTVNITSGAVTGDVYGGRGQSGPATGNSVIIDGTEIVQLGNLYGGYVASGAADAFTGNTLTKNSEAPTIGAARNFQYVYFNYTGNANIGSLSTTPTGSAASGVTLNTGGNAITFGGAITGGGGLTQDGGGALILTADNNAIDGAVVVGSGGTLQLGDGGATGRIAAAGGFNLADSTSSMVYRHADDVTQSQVISGAGKVVQQGLGRLTLAGENTFTGGTEIESGTLRIIDSSAYNQATSPTTKSGYVTFTATSGADQRTALLDYPNPIILINSFRTASGAGNNNVVDLTSSPYVWIYGTNIADPGGAFSVADETEMTLNTNNLFMTNNMAGGQQNDLYVGDGGTFNLNAGNIVMLESGIAGNGTLNVASSTPVGTTALVQLTGSGGPFQMGETNVTGSSDHALFFNLARNPLTNERMVFTNTSSFNLTSDNNPYPSAVLLGDGIIQAGTVNVLSGAVLMPASLELTTSALTPSTLTFNAPEISLLDFRLASVVTQSQSTLSFDAQNIPVSNNSLLNLITGEDGGSITMNGTVYFATTDGTPFTPGDYLIIRSDHGFSEITNDDDLNTALAANIDGFNIPVPYLVTGTSPRGSYKFKLGGDPDSTTGARTTGTTNVWFAHNLNSLSMDWTGGDNAWTDAPLFSSLQTVPVNVHETRFLSGDKVYIAGDNSFTISLPAGSVTNKIMVSGLVVGQDSGELVTNDGNYIMEGDGGITADATSAFGMYVSETLIPTGKLEKYGNSTLTFANTGGNLFSGGIDLYGGVVAFNRANQLGDGGQGIHFMENAALSSYGSVGIQLANTISIATPATATIDVGAGAPLTLSGLISGDGSLNKEGAGTLTLTSDNTYSGGTTISGGVLQLGAGGTSGGIVGDVVNNGTLAFNRSDRLAFDGVISGGGAVHQIGSGTTILSGANSYSGATVVESGTLGAGAENTFSPNSVVTVASAGTLDLDGFNQTVAGLRNAGTVILRGATPGTVLTVTGDYERLGSRVLINTELGDDSSPTDKIVVKGSVTGAPGPATALDVQNTGGIGKATSNGIQVIEVGGTSPADAFALAQSPSIPVGAYEYVLQKGGAVTGGDSWYLVSALNANSASVKPLSRVAGPPALQPIYRPGPTSYVAAQFLNAGQGFQQLYTLHQRVGEHRNLPEARQTWARTSYFTSQEDGETRFGYDQDTIGLQLGQEFLTRRLKRATQRAALAFDYSQTEADFSDRIRPLAGLNEKTGEAEAEAWAFEGYFTQIYDGGAYFDIVSQVAALRNEYVVFESDGNRYKANQDGWRAGISGEVGYPVWQSGKWLLEGQGQLSYQYAGYGDVEDKATKVSDTGAHSLRGRIGGRLARELAKKEARRLESYGVAAIVADLIQPAGVNVDNNGQSVRISESYDPLYGEIGVGLQGYVTGGMSLFTDFRYQRGFDHNNNRHGYALNAGLRVAF